MLCPSIFHLKKKSSTNREKVKNAINVTKLSCSKIEDTDFAAQIREEVHS